MCARELYIPNDPIQPAILYFRFPSAITLGETCFSNRGQKRSPSPQPYSISAFNNSFLDFPLPSGQIVAFSSR